MTKGRVARVTAGAFSAGWTRERWDMVHVPTSVRLLDVAQHAGVSIATASRALSGTSGVSDTVAEHVRNVARELGYVANQHARTLAGGPSSSVGLIVHEI